ncbi:MAG: DUF3881 family protein [Firmicutes bacterium]|uniref:DUF3881 family protein n=1 Tax=Candidatus Scybalomonas excrementavium TaxID=2840943 RepID=A0A9D9N822_9FIRM|nr:DUF3881 family protein [Candidatus Scybalomonas excrementavium]
MNVFIKSIGFEHIKNKKETDELIQWVIENQDKKTVIPVPIADTTYVQVWKKLGEGFGLSVIGELKEDKTVNVEYYFPYVEGANEAENLDFQVEKHFSKEAYSGVCETVNVGVSLIFYLQNIGDLIYGDYSKEYYVLGNKVHLGALASNGSILLELKKDEEQVRREEVSNRKRNQLLQAAREGDMKAIESLTLDDMDTYTQITQRAKSEDILSIVDTYFMPYGIESDQYEILGTIYDIKESENFLTKEKIYLLSVLCNQIHIQVAIPKKHLMGEPKNGRRLKAKIWLQGQVEILKWKG